MSDNKTTDKSLEGDQSDNIDSNIAVSHSEVSSIAGSVKITKTPHRFSSSSERQIKVERAQRVLENAALVSKHIKERRKATAELLGRPFEDDDVGDSASEIASTMSKRSGYSVATDTSTPLSVKEALNIPGISENLANTLKQKELVMEKIKQYKEISKRPPFVKSSPVSKRDSIAEIKSEVKKVTDTSDVSQLVNTVKEKENMLSIMQVKLRAMETTILDLQEKINEKDQIIEAKNMATSLMSDNLNKKEKDSMLLLEDTRQQMTKMQENFIAMETEWKEEKQRLQKEIELKDEKINNLEEANTILENSRFEISVSHSKLAEELDLKTREILQLQDKIEELSKIQHDIITPDEKEEEEKGSLEISSMVELTKKIELLEQLNCQIRQTNKDLENKLATVSEQKSPSTSSPVRKQSPLPARKGKNTGKSKSPWSKLSSESLPQEAEKKPNKNEIAKFEMLIQSLNKEILDKEYTISQKNTLIDELQSANSEKEATINAIKNTQTAPTIGRVDIGISTDIVDIKKSVQANSEDGASFEENSVTVQELVSKLDTAQQQIEALNQDIDTANKNMIKVKSNHKMKIKQMQKTIENFSKVSDANAEIIKLNEELHQLSQKVAELEEEKGNLQLHLVDYDSGRLTESDVYKKLIEMENLAETRLKAISLLETQKFDLVQELHVLQQKYIEVEDKLADLSQFQNEQVCSEMKSVQLEEQIDELVASKKELQLIIENLKLDKNQLNGTIKMLQDEKEELLHKLENYIQENIELTDKLEKLSAEKVSSAESIEIVESLTTQEKLELEEYNKGKISDHLDGKYKEEISHDNEKSTQDLMEQIMELNKKIELFSQEREEVMEKMNKINTENQLLHEEIETQNTHCSTLQCNIDILNNEKKEIQELNGMLNYQIEDLKRERLEIMKETVTVTEIAKPTSLDDVGDTAGNSELQHEDKSTGDKGGRNKSVKQLTKEILKLKNTIKEREEEIADCQMKILSLEENQQKQSDLMQDNASFDMKIKLIADENQQLKEKINGLEKDRTTEKELLQFKQINEQIQEELHNVRQEYAAAITTRDNRIHELENLLLEYEKQIYNYNNTLQLKDKELTDYINQVTKLNDVSQKLKSTIDLLEEEKLKDQNAEIVKSLNKQISSYQKKITESEEKIRILEDEKTQLLSLKVGLENKNINLDSELKNLQETFVEKQSLIKELQSQQQKYVEEVSNVKLQAKERDEEIHEIKLQLRKESIENEKLRTCVSQKEKSLEDFTLVFEENKEKLEKILLEKNEINEQYLLMETKNKELMEKLKKFAVNIKKKSTMYTELESHLAELKKQVETKNEHIEQLSIQVETLPALQEKLKHAEEEINRLLSHKNTMEKQKSDDDMQLRSEIQILEEKLVLASDEILKLNESMNITQKDFQLISEENRNLKIQIDTLQNKLVEHEIDQKNSLNLITKISSLECDINQKQNQIADLLSKIQSQEEQLGQLHFGHNAKVQERDLYIENLEGEVQKYKNRICRLEESISIMEDRRHSLERKADQLDTQLQEKQKAYIEYTSHEDELVNRLAVLMDHDRVVEKQLHVIESDNKELHYKIQHFSDENQHLRKALSDIQEHCNTLVEKASKSDIAEAEIAKYQEQIHQLESNLKRLTNEHQTLLIQRKQDIEDLETEFNTQIENAIKEKKILSEKYEKIGEHVCQLEVKLQEYRNNIENLNLNLEELNKLNHELAEKASSKDQHVSPDYTEQYINEINKLNAIVNSKNQEIQDLNSKTQTIQNNNVSLISNLESNISELTHQLKQHAVEAEQLLKELNIVRHNNEQLEIQLLQKDEVIKDLKDKKKVTFEMNIPKTEGMVISSTIEAVNEEDPKLDISSIQSQIVSDTGLLESENNPAPLKISEYFQASPKAMDVNPDDFIEPTIVPKKAYVCYKKESEKEAMTADEDPFNSDEGWGLGECQETEEVTPGLSYLNNQILQLKKDNEALRADLEVSNTKLIKALKKLKEFKSNNEMLSNELKLSKQLSQSSFLDTAIEDELRNNIQELEKKIEELCADISKEKREKDVIKKQNEIFSSANDKWTEIKEKMDSEIELWKFKFKEVNDKLSTLQWDAKDSPGPKTPRIPQNTSDHAVKDEIIKLENENDELQIMLDQLSSQNKELTSKQTEMINEINDLQKQLQKQYTCKECDITNSRLLELQNNNTELLKDNAVLNDKLSQVEVRYNETIQNYEQLKFNKEEMKTNFENNLKDINEKYAKLENEVTSLRALEAKANNKISSLLLEIEAIKSHEEQQIDGKLQEADMLLLSEKYGAIEDKCNQLNIAVEDANNKIVELESLKHSYELKINSYEQQLNDYEQKIVDIKQQNIEFNSRTGQELVGTISSHNYEDKINELNSKVQKLNTENDQLLSTVTELRSSIASAVDQRGFEISELWKQHLAQREADFQKTEQELRSELNLFETKYEQLLDNVQSSSQEETNKLITMEQINSLQTKLQDKEEHLHNLQNKYAEVINQLDMLRSEIEDEKIMHDNKLLAQQDEYEKVIHELTVKIQKDTENYEHHINSIKKQIEELTAELKNSEDKILELSNQIQVKDSEIYQKTFEYNHTLAQRNEEFENVRKQLIEYEKKIEEISYEKESELAILRLKMHENNERSDKMEKDLENEKLALSETLNAKIIECTTLNKNIADLNQLLEEQSKTAIEMQMALESQEVEIITLKDELSSMQKNIRASSSKIEKHVTFASDTKPGIVAEKSEALLNKELLDAVPRAELDLALYMLHQRDVRCEELTMELTQLLEERDTLQLRLSDSLRSHEELKSKCKMAGLDESISSSQETVSELPMFSVEKEQPIVDIHRGQTSRSSSISDPDGDKPKLQAKLSELRSVKHSRDVLFRHESEQRQMDLRLLQRDVANLPPEAVDQLAQAHHTLSRDAQSTSTVLLNWLRGKSTPKIVHNM